MAKINKKKYPTHMSFTKALELNPIIYQDGGPMVGPEYAEPYEVTAKFGNSDTVIYLPQSREGFYRLRFDPKTKTEFKEFDSSPKFQNPKVVDKRKTEFPDAKSWRRTMENEDIWGKSDPEYTYNEYQTYPVGKEPRRQEPTLSLKEEQSQGVNLPLQQPMTPNFINQGVAPQIPQTSFKEAFADARKQGLRTFEWNGKSYGTRLATETKEDYNKKFVKQLGGNLYNPGVSSKMLNKDNMRRERKYMSDIEQGFAGFGAGLLGTLTGGATTPLFEKAMKDQGVENTSTFSTAAGLTQGLGSTALSLLPALARFGGRFYQQQGGMIPNYQNMGLTEIKGPSHQEGGVTLPNDGSRPDVEVEGPETIYTPENYVFSEKMKASKEALEFLNLDTKDKNKSYADLSKKYKNSVDNLRPHDKLAKEVVDKKLKKLIEAHEIDRELKRERDKENIIANTPQERVGGYNMFPQAQSITFPGQGETQMVPTNDGSTVAVTGADGMTQMLNQQTGPVNTQLPAIEEKIMRNGGKLYYQENQGYLPTSQEINDWNNLLFYYNNYLTTNKIDPNLLNRSQGNLSQNIWNSYIKEHPNFQYDLDWVGNMQEYYNNLITNPITKSKMGSAKIPDKLSKVDKWIGSQTSQYYIPTIKKSKGVLDPLNKSRTVIENSIDIINPYLNMTNQNTLPLGNPMDLDNDIPMNSPMTTPVNQGDKPKTKVKNRYNWRQEGGKLFYQQNNGYLPVTPELYPEDIYQENPLVLSGIRTSPEKIRPNNLNNLPNYINTFNPEIPQEGLNESEPIKKLNYTSPIGNYITGAIGSGLPGIANIIAGAAAPNATYTAPAKFKKLGYKPLALARQETSNVAATTKDAFRTGSPTQASYLSNLSVSLPASSTSLAKMLGEMQYGIDSSNAQIETQEGLNRQQVMEKNALLKDQSIAQRWNLGLKGVEGISKGIQGVSKDLAAKRLQDQMISNMSTQDFSVVNLDDTGKLVLNPSGTATYNQWVPVTLKNGKTGYYNSETREFIEL